MMTSNTRIGFVMFPVLLHQAYRPQQPDLRPRQQERKVQTYQAKSSFVFYEVTFFSRQLEKIDFKPRKSR